MLVDLLDPFLLLKSSISVILQYWHFFIYLLLMQCAFAALTAWFMSDVLMDREALSILSFLGGILGLTLFCLCIVLLKIKPTLTLGLATTIVSFLLLIRLRRYLFSLASSKLVGFSVFFLFILLLRLIFIQGLLVPPYADSVIHLQIVQDFLNPNRPPQAFFHLSLDLGRYYHFGFHSLAAWLSGATSTAPEQTILLLGQYFQALAILAVYPLVRISSKDSLSAWAVMIVAGLILSIPAYTSNWGKYPAIASLTGISFGLSLLLIYAKNKFTFSNKYIWLIGLVILTAACLHSRSLFIFLLAALINFLYTRSGFIFEKLEIKDSDENRNIVIVLWIVMLLTYILGLDFSASAFFYFLIFLFLILTVFAFSFNFVQVWILITFVLAMGINLLLPMPISFLPIRYTRLFDRPFLIIFFYLPASILIWLGLEGGINLLIKNNFEFWRRWLFIGVLTFGIVNAVFIQNHLPSDCCIFMNDEDLFSFHWMKGNIPKGALVGIAATGKPGNLQPADGGAWIEIFTGIPTRKISLFSDIKKYNLDWNIDFVHEGFRLCKEGITHFYVDNLEHSFDEYDLIKVGAQYQFGLGNVRIYNLICNDLQ